MTKTAKNLYPIGSHVYLLYIAHIRECPPRGPYQVLFSVAFFLQSSFKDRPWSWAVPFFSSHFSWHIFTCFDVQMYIALIEFQSSFTSLSSSPGQGSPSKVLKRTCPSSVYCDVINLVLSSCIGRSPCSFVTWFVGEDSDPNYQLIDDAEISKAFTVLIHVVYLVHAALYMFQITYIRACISYFINH